jgi:hypothetical protein
MAICLITDPDNPLQLLESCEVLDEKFYPPDGHENLYRGQNPIGHPPTQWWKIGA